MGKVIAVDGPSGAGKSSVCKVLAERLGFAYLDTGAIYRAVALYLNKLKIPKHASYEEVYTAVSNAQIRFEGMRVWLNQEDVTELIRTPQAGHLASVYSAMKPVRDALLGLQRASALNADIVAEGRDMTTVVFADAWKKFFLDATTECRAMRRYNQLLQKGMQITYEEALKDVLDRDVRDSKRDIAPLKCPPDAVYIDTTYLSFEQVLEMMLQKIRS